MAPYSSPAPSLRSIQYSAPIRSLVLNWASAQLLPAFSSPSRRMHGHGTRPVGLRVFRPETAMVSSLPTWGRCRPESYERVPTHLLDVCKDIGPPPTKSQVRQQGRR